MKTVEYKNLKLRILFAFTTSFFIMFHGRPIDLIKAFSSLSFHIAFSISIAMSLLLMYIVHRVSIRLDKKYDWKEKPFERSILQFLFGVVAPSLLDLVIISIYFYTLNQNISENGYLLVDYPIIVCFIIFFNLYYLIYYLVVTGKNTASSVVYNDSDKNYEPSILVINNNSEELKFDVAQDVFYFYRDGKHIRLVSFDGAEYTIKETIGNLTEKYKHINFIQINRSIILNFETVKTYAPRDKRYTLKLIFKNKYLHLIEQRNFNQFIVTKEHLSKVKSRFAQKNGFNFGKN